MLDEVGLKRRALTIAPYFVVRQKTVAESAVAPVAMSPYNSFTLLALITFSLACNVAGHG